MSKVLCIKSDCLNLKPGTPGALNNVKEGDYYYIDLDSSEDPYSDYIQPISYLMCRVYSLNKDYIGNFYKKDFIETNTAKYRDYILTNLLK